MSQAQGRVPGHGALAVQDFGYTVGGHLELARQFRGAHVQLFKLCGEMFSRMYGTTSHNAPHSMVIDDFNIYRPRRAFWPFEANPPWLFIGRIYHSEQSEYSCHNNNF